MTLGRFLEEPSSLLVRPHHLEAPCVNLPPPPLPCLQKLSPRHISRQSPEKYLEILLPSTPLSPEARNLSARLLDSVVEAPCVRLSLVLACQFPRSLHFSLRTVHLVCRIWISLSVYSRCCIRICSAMVGVPHRTLLPSLSTWCRVQGLALGCGVNDLGLDVVSCRGALRAPPDHPFLLKG